MSGDGGIYLAERWGTNGLSMQSDAMTPAQARALAAQLLEAANIINNEREQEMNETFGILQAVVVGDIGGQLPDVPAGRDVIWRKLPIPKLGAPNEGKVAPDVYIDPRDSVYHGEVVGSGWRFEIRKDHRAGYWDTVWSSRVQVYLPRSDRAQWDGWVTVEGGSGWEWEAESLKILKVRAEMKLRDEGLTYRGEA